MTNKWSDEVIERLREYLRIPSVHPDVDYSGCVSFLRGQADSIGLPSAVYELVPKKPVVVITWEGTQPELPAVMFNSHMDVVPVYEEHWTYPPFEAVISEDGWIYARGSQDDKSMGMQNLEALRRLTSAGVRLKRTVHVTFVPDEEIDGANGMGKFSESEEFKKLNVAFAMDESMPSSTGVYVAFNGERTSRHIKVSCLGTPGHGSLLGDNTAGEKLHYVIDKFMKLRKEEKMKLKAGKPLGEVMSINLTKIEGGVQVKKNYYFQGGVQVNVLPEVLSVSFDIRIPPALDHQEIEDMIKRWCSEAGEGVTFEYYVKNPAVGITKTDGSVPFWNAFTDALKQMDKKLTCMICPGATDARYVRRQGVPAVGFSAMTNTPLLLHAHDERLHVDEYKTGVQVMENVIKAVANV